MKHEIIYERSELFDVNMVITIIIDILGKMSETELNEAFQKAIRVNEILLSKIVIENDGRAFYVDNASPKSSITVVDKELDLIRQEEEKIRFKIEEGEFIRAFAKEDNNGFSILFLMNHMAGDGMSLEYFIEDFMTYLSGGSKTYKKIRTVETKENLDSISRGIVRYYNRRWKDKVFTFEDMQNAYECYWKNRSTVIESTIIEKSEMDKILEECHRTGVKFTSYLTAKLIKDENKKMAVGYAMDYRHDNNHSMGNQASGFSIKYKYNSSKNVFENAQKIQKKIDKKMKEHKKGSYILNFVAGIKPTLHDAVNLEHTGIFHNTVSYSLAKLMGYVGKTKDYSITNLTVIDIPIIYGEYEITRMLFAGPVVSYGKRIISVVTCNGKTVITKHERLY